MPPTPLSFLYIDDDPMSRSILKIMLETLLGAEQVLILANSENFTKLIQNLPFVPTLILLDIQVRPYNGYEMLAMLRADPRYAGTRIVALTANVMASDVEKMKAAGFDGLIGKPFNHRVFLGLMKSILAGETIWYIS